MSRIKNYYHDEICSGPEYPDPPYDTEQQWEAEEIKENMHWWRHMDEDADYIAGLDDGEGPKEKDK